MIYDFPCSNGLNCSKELKLSSITKIKFHSTLICTAFSSRKIIETYHSFEFPLEFLQ